MNKATLAVLLTIIGITAIAGRSNILYAEQLPVVTRDTSGKEVVVYVSREKYSRNIVDQISTVQAEAVPALNQMKQGKQWRVRTASLGIGIDIQLGLPYLISLGITPRFNAIFSNAKTPAIP